MPATNEILSIDNLLSPSSFWFPEALIESAWHQHAPFAFWLMEALKPRQFVELGTHHGFSYLTFCQAAERSGIATRGYAVDTWHGDEHAGFYDDAVYTRLRELHDARYGGFSRLVRSTFDEALSHFADGSIDLLHIDGRHFYDDVKHDFESWKNKLSNRAIVLFHDTNVRERGFGVFKFWQEVRSQYSSFEFLHGHGLGVLGVGAELASPVTTLFEVDAVPAHCANVRNTYSRLGSSIEDQYTLSRLTEKLHQSDVELAQFRQTVITTENHLAQQITRINDLERLAKRRLGKTTALRIKLAINNSRLRRVKRDLAEQQVRTAEQAMRMSLIESEFNEQRHQRDLVELRLGERLRQSTSSRWLLKSLGRKIVHMPRDVSRRARRSLAKRWNKPTAIPSIEDRGPHTVHRVMSDPRFRKYISSRLVLKMRPILPRRIAERMHNRMAKNAVLGAFIDQDKQEILLGINKKIPANLKIAVGIVTYNNTETELNRVIVSALDALARVGNIQKHSVLIIDNGCESKFSANEQITRVPSKGNIGFGAAHNVLMAQAFQTGAEAYICANPDGAFHPDSIKNLVQMALAHDFNALLEALQFPEEHAKVYDHQTFETPWVSGACLMIPKKIYRSIGGFDEDFFMYCEDVDISWRARAENFSVKTCPSAFFFHDYFERDGGDVKRFMLRSGYILARKWGDKSFECHMCTALAEIDDVSSLPAITPRQRRDSFRPDFSKQFHFATVRW